MTRFIALFLFFVSVNIFAGTKIIISGVGGFSSCSFSAYTNATTSSAVSALLPAKAEVFRQCAFALSNPSTVNQYTCHQSVVVISNTFFTRRGDGAQCGSSGGLSDIDARANISYAADTQANYCAQNPNTDYCQNSSASCSNYSTCEALAKQQVGDCPTGTKWVFNFQGVDNFSGKCDSTSPVGSIGNNGGAGSASGGVGGNDCSGCKAGTNICTVDDLPYDAGNSLGYYYCDRPPLKQCANGKAVLKTAICDVANLPACNSKASCCELAIDGIACDTTTNHITCDYQENQNGDVSATATCVAGSKPTDDNKPTYVNVDNSDVIRQLIRMQNDNQNLLNYVSSSNRSAIARQTNALQSSQRDNANRIIQAIELKQLTGGGSGDNTDIVNAVNTANASAASTVSSSINDLKNARSTLPDKPKEAAQVASYVTALNNSDFGRMINNFKNIQIPAANCQPFTIDLSATPIGRSISTNVVCDLAAQMKTPVGAVMYIFYLIIAFRVVASS